MTQTDPVSPAQRQAAHAYANVLLEADVATAAADDAIAAFRETLGTRGQSVASAAEANTTLLALTRLMTAVSLPDRSSPEDRRQAVWASIGATSHCTCREAAALLATRANANIQPRESAALDEHLASCAECRELSVQTVTADAAFRAALVPPSGGLGGGGLPGGPRAGAVLLAVLIALAAGIYALSSGGSSSSRASAAPAPVHTQTAEAVALSVPTVATPARPHRHAGHHGAVAKPAHRHVTEHPRTTTQSTPTATVTTTASAVSAGAPTTVATDAAATPPAQAASPAASPATHTAAPSTAAQVSGPSSLPADSAPQQGIGSLTSTTP